MWVQYYNLGRPRKAHELHTRLRRSGAKFYADGPDSVVASIAEQHRRVVEETAAHLKCKYRWLAVSPDLTRVHTSPCGLQWLPGHEKNFRMHEAHCKSCKRVNQNATQGAKKAAESAQPNPIPSLGPQNAPADAGDALADGVRADHNASDAAIHRLRAIGATALELASDCEEAVQAIEAVQRYDEQMQGLRREYANALAGLQARLLDLLPFPPEVPDGE